MKRTLLRICMMLFAGLFAQLTMGQTWYPVYILDVKCYTLQVMGGSQAGATTYAALWEDRIDNTAFHISLTMPFPPATGIPKPERYPRDKVLINEVWHVLGDLPSALTGVAKVPTLAEWQAIPEGNIDDTIVFFPFTGFEYRNDPLIVNYDNPSYAPTWRPYTFYYNNYRAYVWYVQSTSKTAAIAAVKALWITNGVYKMKRPITQDEVFAWEFAKMQYDDAIKAGNPIPFPTTATVAGKIINVPDLPKLPWMKLFQSSVIKAPTYPTESLDSTGAKTSIGMLEPDTFEKLVTGPYAYYPPYNWRDLTLLPARSWWR